MERDPYAPRSKSQKSNGNISSNMERSESTGNFHEEEDWIMFLDIFKKYKLKLKLNVYAWCLMSNHVHLLIKEGNEDISTSMKRMGVSYAGYYNWKYRITGHLFQDRFRSENVEDLTYFKPLLDIYIKIL